MTSLCSQWFTSGLEEQWQISTFPLPKPESVCSSCCSWCCSNPNCLHTPYLTQLGPRFDACPAETDPAATRVAVGPLCLRVPVTDGCHGVLHCRDWQGTRGGTGRRERIKEHMLHHLRARLHISASLMQPQWEASPGGMCSPGGSLLALPGACGALRKEGRMAVKPFAHSPQIGREHPMAVQR